MKLDVKSMALVGGTIWGAGVLLVVLANLIWPNYGRAFLDVMASVYPGYSGQRTIAQAVVGTLYAFVDGGIATGLAVWLYNRFPRG